MECAMKDWRYNLHIEDCRAIKMADINLSEITVLSGVNASGKSTIARMFRDLIEVSACYDRLLAGWFWMEYLADWYYFVYSAWRRIKTKEDDSSIQFNLLHNIDIYENLVRGKITLDEAIDGVEDGVRKLMSILKTNQEAMTLRYIRPLMRRFGVEDNEQIILAKFSKRKNSVLQLYSEAVQRRTRDQYRKLLPETSLFDGSVTLQEGDASVFTSLLQSEKLEEISWLKRAIYIESPFKSIPKGDIRTTLKMGDDPFVRIHHLNELLPQLKDADTLFNVLSGTIGFESFEDSFEDERWMYHRLDGRDFSLDECATGIKSFSILNILFMNGWLNSETLLIIDEPEVHLHPQWVVEYAKILLLLAKKFKVRLLLTSHSPDMINALHTIGKSMGLSDVMNFYLAEKDSVDPYKYNYRSLGCKVGDIFKAYNVSFSKIEDYANHGEY